MDQPNGMAVLIELVKNLPAIIAAVAGILVWLGNRRNEPKIDDIHVNTNGKSEKQDQRIAELEAHIEDLKRDGRGPV